MDPGFKVLHDLHLSPLRCLGDPPLLPSLGGLLHRVCHLAEGDISISTTLLWLYGSHLLQGQGVGVHLQMVGSAVEELEEDIPDDKSNKRGNKLVRY